MNAEQLVSEAEFKRNQEISDMETQITSCLDSFIGELKQLEEDDDEF